MPRRQSLKILIYGAGVIGSLYAARLQEAGHRVTVLARPSRAAEIQQHGLVLEDVLTGLRSATRVESVSCLGPEDLYDLVIVAVRMDQLPDVLPELAANPAIPLVLFLLNNPMGSAALVHALGSSRVLLGFPGAGGALEGGVVRFAIIPQQPTTLGKAPQGEAAPLLPVAEALRAAGFPTRIDSDMDAWLCTHAFFITSICAAIYLAAGDCRQLSRNPELLALMVGGVREGFRAVRALGHPVHPFALNVLFNWMPRFFAIQYWRRFMAHPNAEFIFARHARHASAEMLAIANQCRRLLIDSRVSAPSLTRLYRAIDLYAQLHPDLPRIINSGP